MTSNRHRRALSPLFSLFAATLLVSGCGTEPEPQEVAPPPSLTLGHVEAPLVENGDFENGSLSGWTTILYRNNIGGLKAIPPATFPDLNLASTAGSVNLTSAVYGETETQVPAGLSARSTLRYPRYGQWAAVVNKQGKSYNTNALRQTFTVTNADVDPADGKVHVRFTLAPVLENPGHPAKDQPYFYVLVRNATRNTQLLSKFAYSNQPGVPWQKDPQTGVLYTDWQAFDIAPGPTNIAIGDRVELTVLAAGCAQSAHYGHAYVDSFGAFLPGLSIAASAPSSVNAGSNLTYAYLAKNSGTGVANRVIVTQPLPENTTFVSFNAPGATCTAPAVGSPGAVTCELGDLNPTAGKTFQVTVRVNPAATAGTVISNGSYTVRADGVSPLIGPLVETIVTRNVTYVDLALKKTDGIAAIGWGQKLQYTIEVTNLGPSAASSARVNDILPPQLASATWTCAATGGGICGAAAGAGNIETAVSVPVGGKVVFTVNATVINGSGSGSVSNVASVTSPSGVVDNDTSNNDDVDTDSIGDLFELRVSKAPESTGTGRVISSPAAIDCGALCPSAAARFLTGTLVSVTATATPGDTFAGWTGACTGTANPCNFVVTKDSVLTAKFVSPKATDGSTCSVANDCLSGSCVDGVCCNTGCTGQCMACNVPGKVGQCSAVTGAPVGGRPACATDGSVCGGACNGSSPTCVYPSTSTLCRDASCSGNVETHSAYCNGQGACPSPSTATCNPYVCGANACLTKCTKVEECSSGNYCSTQGQCLYDLDPPVLSLPANIVLEATSCSAGTQVTYTATAVDAVVGPVPVTCVPASGSVFKLGTTTVNCSAQDGHGNTARGSFTITVVDTTPPDLQLIGFTPMSLECGSVYVEPGATASDICSGDLTSSIVTTGSANGSVVGAYSIHYSVTDGAGLSASKDRVVNVQDTLAPTITLNAGPSVLQCSNNPYQDPGATASDVCAGDLTSSIVVSGSVNPSQAGQYTLSYRVTDPSGHAATAVRQLTVEPCCVNTHLSDYNLLVLENYVGGKYIAGKAAVGGNLSLVDFTMGDNLPADGISNALVVGGDLSLSKGTIWGDVRHGGRFTSDRSVIFRRGTVAQGSPINFVERFAELRSMSAKLGALATNGTKVIKSWGTIQLTGTNTSRNVFELSASDFTGANTLAVSVPAGSLIVLNIRGGTVTLPGFGFRYSNGVKAQDVIFNFPEATRVDVTSVNFQGSVLAPNANVTITNGAWNGGLYAVSLTANTASGHLSPLRDRDICSQ